MDPRYTSTCGTIFGLVLDSGHVYRAHGHVRARVTCLRDWHKARNCATIFNHGGHGGRCYTGGNKMETANGYTFGERQKVKKESYIKDDSIVIRFVFRNGTVREHVFPLTSPLLHRAAMHGLDQKFGDELAGLYDVEDCIEAFDELSQRISQGEWSERRQSTGLSGTSLLAQALSEVGNMPIDVVKGRLAKLSREQKNLLAKQKDVAARIIQLKAERAARQANEDAQEELARFLAQ